MRAILFVVALIAVVMIASCGDDVTNNYFRNDTGTIFGTVSPVDSGVVRAIGDKIYEGKLTDAGTFRIENLIAGNYSLEVIPNNYSKRLFRGIAVKSGESVPFSSIALSQYPYPIYRTDPGDNSKGFGGSSINLYVDDLLDIDELNRATHVVPQPDNISWQRLTGYTYDYNDVYITYTYYSLPINRQGKAGVRLGTNYTVTIDSTVHTGAGTLLSSSLHISFVTALLSVNVILPKYSISGLVSIASFSPSLKFSNCVFPDSVNRAVRFDPPIEGLWLSSPGNDYYISCNNPPWNYYYRFFLTSQQPLADTKYKLIVDNDVALLEDVTFMTPDTVIFTTESYGVESVVPINGAYHVAADASITISFNTPMDTVTVPDNFRVEKVNGDVVPGVLSWPVAQRHLVFSHPDQIFESQGVYKVTLVKGSRTERGPLLEKDFTSYFVVE